MPNILAIRYLIFHPTSFTSFLGTHTEYGHVLIPLILENIQYILFSKELISIHKMFWDSGDESEGLDLLRVNTLQSFDSICAKYFAIRYLTFHPTSFTSFFGRK